MTFLHICRGSWKLNDYIYIIVIDIFLLVLYWTKLPLPTVQLILLLYSWCSLSLLLWAANIIILIKATRLFLYDISSSYIFILTLNYWLLYKEIVYHIYEVVDGIIFLHWSISTKCLSVILELLIFANGIDVTISA